MSMHRRGGSGGGSRRKNAVAGALLAALLCACAGRGELAQTPPRPDRVEKISAEEKNPGGALSPDLLYDLLLARIAAQTGNEHIALDAYTRAALHLRRRDLTEKALLLALRLNARPRIAELSALLDKLGGKSRKGRASWLSNAGAIAATNADNEELALRLLVDIVRAYPKKEKVLREVANTLIEQARRPGRDGILARFHERRARWPKDAALHWVAALVAREFNDSEAAAESIDAVLQLRPGWQSAAVMKLSLLADTSVSAMRAFADEFLRAHPQAARARIEYGQLLLRAEYIEPALEQFQKALARQPHSPDTLLAAGIAMTRLQKTEPALMLLQMFLEERPRHVRARLYLAEAELARGNLDAATVILRKIASPQHALDAQLQLASVAAARGGIDAGIAHLRKLKPRDEAERIRIIMEQDALFREYGLPLRALTAFDRALEETPEQADLLYQRGLLAAQLDRLELHERDMRAVLALQPDNAHAHNALGYTLADRNERLGEASSLITRALELLPNDPFILDSMGWLQFRLGRHDSAIAYLRRALDIRRDAETAAHLGEALWAAGKRREAREIWMRGREWSPDNATLQDTIKRLWRDASLRAPRALASAADARAR